MCESGVRACCRICITSIRYLCDNQQKEVICHSANKAIGNNCVGPSGNGAQRIIGQQFKGFAHWMRFTALEKGSSEASSNILIVFDKNPIEALNYQAIAYAGSAKMIKSYDTAHTVHHITTHFCCVHKSFCRHIPLNRRFSIRRQFHWKSTGTPNNGTNTSWKQMKKFHFDFISPHRSTYCGLQCSQAQFQRNFRTILWNIKWNVSHL